MDVCSCKPSGIFVCLLCDLLLVDLLYCAFFFFQVLMCVCVLPVIQYAHMNMCCMVTRWKSLTLQMCVGRLCSGSSVCGVVADGKQLSFAPVCVCVWCGQRLKRALVHMGTNDRIWFGEPICKKMKETKLVKIRAETLPDLPQRFHCSIRWSGDGQQFLLCISSTVMSHHSNLNATTASKWVI